MLTIPLFTLEERSDGLIVAIDELNPMADWFSELRSFAYRLWDGLPCYGMDGRLYLERTRPIKEEWEADEIPTGIVNMETGKRYGFTPVTGQEDDPYWEAYERYLIGLCGRRDDPSSLPNGEYTLLVPGYGSPYDEPEYPTLIENYAMAYLHVPTTYRGMRAWLAKHEMKGLRWVANDPSGARIEATVETRHFFPDLIARAS